MNWDLILILQEGLKIKNEFNKQQELVQRFLFFFWVNNFSYDKGKALSPSTHYAIVNELKNEVLLFTSKSNS